MFDGCLVGRSDPKQRRFGERPAKEHDPHRKLCRNRPNEARTARSRGVKLLDILLGLAFLNVIIEEDLYDHDFCEKYTHGFKELAEHVHKFTPEWAEPITWVPADKIRALLITLSINFAI